ncbi:MAG: TrmH family RNA methyltransferase [Bacilli bacterium]|nr:TrmH family RNA methyltransferase [Bacilli bacterium]
MRQYKKDNPLSYALGMTLVFELIQSHPKQVREVYFHTKHRPNEHTEKLIRQLNDYHIPYQEQDKIFNILSPKDNCFVIAAFEKYESSFSKGKSHIVLVEPENAGNLGTIIRTALGFGIDHLVLIGKHVDFFDPRVIRASMGAIFHVRIVTYPSFEAYKMDYSSQHFYPFMLQTNQILGSAPIESPYSLIFGPESQGLDDGFLSIGTPIRIAHNKAIDSLNITSAISIALYEATKQEFISKGTHHE